MFKKREAISPSVKVPAVASAVIAEALEPEPRRLSKLEVLQAQSDAAMTTWRALTAEQNELERRVWDGEQALAAGRVAMDDVPMFIQQLQIMRARRVALPVLIQLKRQELDQIGTQQTDAADEINRLRGFLQKAEAQYDSLEAEAVHMAVQHVELGRATDLGERAAQIMQEVQAAREYLRPHRDRLLELGGENALQW